MHNDGNVVPLRRVALDQAMDPPLARLPVIALQVRDKATQQLRQALQTLFDNADDTLFEMADRALDDVEQNLFFEAMRDLRLKRKSIERLFFEQFFEAFISLGQCHLAYRVLPRSLSTSTRAALPDDGLERNLAVDAMVNKVLYRDGFALDQLTARLSTLLGRTLIEQHNPLGPTMLCKFFLGAGRHLGVDIKVKMVILQLFDRYVLSGAGQLYAQANQLLMATGVLPGLAPAPTSDTTENAIAAALAAPAGPAAENHVPEVFANLQNLLLPVRSSVAATPGASPSTQQISNRELLRLLSHLQQHEPFTVNDSDLRGQLQQLLNRVWVKSGKSWVIEGVDADAIQLTVMLFDCILADATLPDRLKTLIARLRIPLVKVAVLDKHLFSHSSHPARRLLDEIARAAQGWGEADGHERDSLYRYIEQMVLRLLNEFGDDPAIFSELLAEFLAFTRDERRRSELLEQRIRDAEEGRAQTALARQRVEQALNQELLGKTLPHSVLAFVHDAWSNVLLLTCLKHGHLSPQWQADVQALADLIWSVQRHDQPDAPERLLTLVPGLLKSLREGLSRSAFDPFSTSAFFSELERLHVQSFEQPGHSPAGASVLVEVLEPFFLQTAEEGQLQSGAVRVLDDGALFGRGLASVIAKLQRLNRVK